MAGLPAAERERVMGTVLQLLADGVITPYSGERTTDSVAAKCRLRSRLSDASWCCVRRLLLLACTESASDPSGPSACSCLPAGERFSLEDVVAAAKASKADARGGKVLLEG